MMICKITRNFLHLIEENRHKHKIQTHKIKKNKTHKNSIGVGGAS